MSCKEKSGAHVEEFTGTFVERIHRSQDESFCVCLFKNADKKSKEKFVTVVGADIPEVAYPVTFRGTWRYSYRYNRNEFQVDMLLNNLPDKPGDIKKFIISLKVGIGSRRAEKMIALCGAETFWDELEKDPMQFTAVSGVTQKMIVMLQEKIGDLAALRGLVQFFGDDLVMNAKQYQKIRRYFDNDSKEILSSVKDNPFILMNCEYTFQELDYFSSRQTTFPVNDYRRLLAAAQQVLLDAQKNSHVALPHDLMVENMGKLVKKQGYVHPADIDGFLYSASQRKDLRFDCGLYYLPRSYEEEEMIAGVLARMATKEPEKINRAKFDKKMAKYAATKGFSLSENQQEAVWTALTHSLCVITGGPGTGKSTILDALLYCWEQFFDKDWMLMAPTGKASVRMTETTGEAASTIHSTLGLNVGNTGFNEMDYHTGYTDKSLVVLDETSMLDQTVTASLCMALVGFEKKTQHLVLVGDPDQLPSVGWGNVLADLIESGVIPVCRLNTVYRQGKESPIITNSLKINSGDVNLKWDDPNFRRYHTGSDADNMQTACELYRRLVSKLGVERVAVLSPYHTKTDISTNALNKNLQDIINPDRGQNQIKVKGFFLRENDRVMQLANTETLANGDVGTIQWIDPNASGQNACLCVKFENGMEVDYSREAIVQLDLAYAMSVHKSQGSQWDAVIFILPNAPTAFLRRNLLYTAITRSKQYVAVFGPTETISHCIRNQKQDHRYTGLVARLRILLSPLSPEQNRRAA